MEASAVGRLICVTGFEAGDSCSCGGSLYNAALYLFGRLYSDKDDQERIIPKSTQEPARLDSSSGTSPCRIG